MCGNDFERSPGLPSTELSGIVKNEAFGETELQSRLVTAGLGLGNGEQPDNQFITDPSMVPRSSIIAWLAEMDEEVATEVALLQANRPNLFTHALQRLQYVRKMAIQAGRREVLNSAAKKLLDI